MRVSVIGLGYVGAVTSVCLAHEGHDVVGVDVDETKLGLLRNGESPVIEEGIQDLTRAVVENGRLQVQNRVDERIQDCQVVFVCVGTPSKKNGDQDLAGLLRVTRELGEILRVSSDHYPVLVYRSTVQPGTTHSMVAPLLEEVSGKQIGVDFGVCFQPEFLREGSSIRDFYNPPFTVVGGDSDKSVDVVAELFKGLAGEFVRTSIGTGEMLKLACNAFHALKVSFANEIARLSHEVDVNPRDVMELVCRDTTLNISPAYLKPGFAFGGSCLPKDLRSLNHIARTHAVNVPVLHNILESNTIHLYQALELVMAQGERDVALMGLSFKQGTDDLRESPLVRLAELLIGKGCRLRIYDPAVKMAQILGSNKAFIASTIPHLEELVTDDPAAAGDGAGVLIVGHRSDEIMRAVRRQLEEGGKVIDLVGIKSEFSDCPQVLGLSW